MGLKPNILFYFHYVVIFITVTLIVRGSDFMLLSKTVKNCDLHFFSESTVAYYTSPKVRARLLQESDLQWGNNRAAKPMDIPNESFRKLTVD